MNRITNSVSVAIKAAVISFEKAYRENEDLDSILGYTDNLTRIPNRKAFDRDKKLLKQNLALIFIDIDKFKDINDTKGHACGDIVLTRLAAILHRQAGAEGTPYRIGGDEFALIIPKHKAAAICEAIRNSIRREDTFTISQGVVFDPTPEAIDEQIHLADKALYKSKQDGRNRVTLAQSC